MLGAYHFRPVVARTRTRPPAVFRSGLLWLSTPRARRRMAALGITLVVDLRSPAAARSFPDRPVPGARRVLVDVIGADDVLGTPEGRDLFGEGLMKARYVAMANRTGQRARVAEVLRTIADHDGGVLVHCTDGKDRTGWVAALLQHIGGDDAAAVREAYLASGRRVRLMGAARLVGDLVRHGPAYAHRRMPVNTVAAAYLDSGLNAVTAEWGDLDGYLREGLGLDRATLHRLRDRVV
ncbi:tyrosine-protein phosphatase [Mariniluteicoccus endophyticus]